MRIAIDATALPPRPGGGATYTIQLVRHLPRLEPGAEFHVFCKQRDAARLDTGAANVRLVVVKLTSRLARLVWEQAGLPRALRCGGISLLHSPHFTMPLGRVPVRRLVTLHDLAAFRASQSHSLVKRRFFRGMSRRVAAAADRILTDTEAVAEEIESVLGVARERIDVIPLAADAVFAPLADAAQPEAALPRLGLRRPLVLYVGERSLRKDLACLVDAVERSSGGRAPMLALVGPDGRGSGTLRTRIARSTARERIRVLPPVSEADLVRLYNAADVFVYPSRYEGFGLPVIEAMACGTPVVTSDTPTLREVAGGAALTFRPGDAGQLAAAIDGLLADPVRRERLAGASRARARELSWTTTAQLTADAYRRALGATPTRSA